MATAPVVIIFSPWQGIEVLPDHRFVTSPARAIERNRPQSRGQVILFHIPPEVMRILVTLALAQQGAGQSMGGVT